MRLLKVTLLVLGISFIASSCGRNSHHFISDRQYRRQVNKDFEKVKSLAVMRDAELFGVFDKDLSIAESEALRFLYAYMPINDLADRDGEFFLNNVRLAFQARELFPWGKDIPEDIFRHFVLPHRVNNEVLDTARKVFMEELQTRLQGMSLKEAALEVNHWCHEKVNYQPTDSRTISPLNAIKTAYGRCGEESVFTVTALRSVGIPARQVYTPRWAHTDDNHAWVEVWVDGQWHFMGACEPEPDLDMAWFAEPVLRAMMVHTNAFGNYHGKENVIRAYDKYARLNLLQNYTDTRTVMIQVLTKEGQPAGDAYFEFGLYNYAEFYPLTSGKTNEAGFASIETGRGDLQVFASDKRDHFGLARIRSASTDTFQISLVHKTGDNFELEFDNIPPQPHSFDKVESPGSAMNAKRLLEEDSIRQHYVQTFITEEDAKNLAMSLGLDADRVWHLLSTSRGNWPVIHEFLLNKGQSEPDMVMDLLESLCEKDLHDIRMDVLEDHAMWASVNLSDSVSTDQISYLLNPRVDLEELTPYRKLFSKSFERFIRENDSLTMASLILWTRDSIHIDSNGAYYNIKTTPAGVYSLRVCDPASRDIFLVAAARSLGIMARLDEATRVPQYFLNQWIDVKFSSQIKDEVSIRESALLEILYHVSDVVDPQYYVRFSLAKLTGGRFVTLEYEWSKPLSSFPPRLELAPGYYRLLSGNRQADGSVLVRQVFFELSRDSIISVPLIIRAKGEAPKLISNWPEAPMRDLGLRVLIWIDPGTEPGTHLLKDLESKRNELIHMGIPLAVFSEDEVRIEKLKPFLPTNHVTDIDSGEKLAAFVGRTKNMGTYQLPVILVTDKEQDVYLYLSGYQIGSVEQVMKVVLALKQKGS